MKFIPTGVSKMVAKTALKLQHGSPTLLLAGGIVGVTTTVVLASRATLKLEGVLDQAREDSVLIEATSEDRGDTPEQLVKYKAAVKIKLVLNIAKLYGPTVIVGAASIAMLVSSHNILNRRNAAVTAAYVTLDKSFRAYRARVVEQYGAEQDRDFVHGAQTERVTEVDPKTGKKVSKDEKKYTTVSEYGVLFDPSNPNWVKNPDTNIYTLRCIQNMANDRLRTRGYLSLNDVYKELGVDTTSAGQVVGWALDEEGDGYVDFGIFSSEDPYKLHDYMTGREDSIWIDPNVDGLFYNKIDQINKAKHS